jgi:hypothetical protein
METMTVMGILHLSMEVTITPTHNKRIMMDMPKHGAIWDGTLTATEDPIDTTIGVNIHTVETRILLEITTANGT